MSIKFNLLYCFLFATVLVGISTDGLFADFVFRINTLNEDELSFSINGSFDADVAGDQRNWLAVKNDWENNAGSNVDWIIDSAGFDELNNISGLIVVENSITINGMAPVSSVMAAESFEPWGDSVYFDAGFDLTAGMVVSGTVTLVGEGFFDPSANNLQLVSGFDDASLAWNRLEANVNVIPEPAAIMLPMLLIVTSLNRCQRRI